jgi:RNA polymerase sigma factor (sigma-70 family)
MNPDPLSKLKSGLLKAAKWRTRKVSDFVTQPVRESKPQYYETQGKDLLWPTSLPDYRGNVRCPGAHVRSMGREQHKMPREIENGIIARIKNGTASDAEYERIFMRLVTIFCHMLYRKGFRPESCPDLFHTFFATISNIITRFDPARNTRISSYAGWWYLVSIQVYKKSIMLVHIPQRRKGRHFEELSGWDSPVREEDGEKLTRSEITATNALQPDEALMHKEDIENVQDALAQLDNVSATIVRCLYQIDAERQSLEQLSIQFGVTRERVRKMKNDALRTVASSLGINLYALETQKMAALKARRDQRWRTALPKETTTI